jgi:hypothetical protein
MGAAIERWASGIVYERSFNGLLRNALLVREKAEKQATGWDESHERRT